MVHGGMIGRKEDRVTGAAVSSFIAQTITFLYLDVFLLGFFLSFLDNI